MLNLPTQHKPGTLQGLIVQQPVQFRPLRRGVAVFVLDSDAVNGKGGAILKSASTRLVSMLKRQESSFIIVISS